MSHGNLIGPSIAKLRNQRGWTQEMLAVKMQVQGCDISRGVIANIESRRTYATDTQIVFFMRAFKVRLDDLFPQEVHQLDLRPKALMPEPDAES